MLFRRAHNRRNRRRVPACTLSNWHIWSRYHQLRRELGDSIPMHILPDDECSDDATLFDTTCHQAITIAIDTEKTQEIHANDRRN